MPNEGEQLEAITQRAVADMVELVADPGVSVPAEVRDAVAAALRESHAAVSPFGRDGRSMATTVEKAQERACEAIGGLLFPSLPRRVSEDTANLVLDSIRERVARFHMDIAEALLKFMREELRRRQRPH